MSDNLSPSMTPKELAARWRVRVAFVRGLIKCGRLPAFVINGRTKIAPESVFAAETALLAVSPTKKHPRKTTPKEVLELLNE